MADTLLRTAEQESWLKDNYVEYLRLRSTVFSPKRELARRWDFLENSEDYGTTEEMVVAFNLEVELGQRCEFCGEWVGDAGHEYADRIYCDKDWDLREPWERDE